MKTNCVEINLSLDKTIQYEEAIIDSYFIGLELENGKRYFITEMHSDNENVYCIIDPRTMAQYGTLAYESLEKMFHEFKRNSSVPVKKFMAFRIADELFYWTSGNDTEAGFVVIFDSSKVELNELPEDSIVGVEICNESHYFITMPHGRMLINGKTNAVIQNWSDHPIGEVLKEVKKSYGDVKAYSFTDPGILHGWIYKNISQGGFYELTA